jgi:hypothetical protein
MKTIFDRATRDELITRVSALDEKSKPHWGKMNIYQMTRHCTVWDEWILGKNYSNEDFIHDFFGKMTKEQIGVFAYKHTDHHLRQFGV